jgi:hypothetical protein
MRSRLINCFITRYPPLSLLTKVKNQFRRTQVIKPQFLPTPKQVYGLGLLAVQVDANRTEKKQDPIIAVHKGSRPPVYYHEVEITGTCRMIYRPDKPLSCGAVLWLPDEIRAKWDTMQSFVKRL